jgi:portal protein
MLLESREFDAKQIAAAFGVPAPLLNMTLAGGMTYTNPAMLFDLWWRSELMPVGKRFENALSRWLPRGSWVEFDAGQVTKPDLAGMVASWVQLLDREAVTVDELRAAVLDLPPLSQGEAIAELDEPAGAGPSVVGTETVVAVPRPDDAGATAPVVLGVVQ